MKLTWTMAFLLAANVAYADRVHLKSGSVLEGRATRDGDRVVVELESGEIALAADDVARIEAAPTPLARVEAERAALAKDDVEGRIELAAYCRDQGLRAQQAELLREVLALEPEHVEARWGLGFVKHEGVWMTQDEALVAQGYVQHGGQWMTREHVLELQRLQAGTKVAELERDKAKVELATAQAELEKTKQQAVESKAAAEPTPQASTMTYYAPYAPYYAGYDAYGRLMPVRSVARKDGYYKDAHAHGYAHGYAHEHAHEHTKKKVEVPVKKRAPGAGAASIVRPRKATR